MTRSHPAGDRVEGMLGMMSRISRANVRADSPDTLYRDICRVAVECGMYRFAWIGLFDADADRLRTVTSFGTSCVAMDMLVAPDGVARVVHDAAQVCVFNDWPSGLMQSQEHSVAQTDFYAVAGVPLREGTRAVGVLLLYAHAGKRFDEATIRFLQEIGEDVAYALAHMLDEQRRLAVESRLYYLAFYDTQTGLPNRTLLEERLPQLARRGRRLALFDMQLQRLDKMAEIYGRTAMDEVLRMLAHRLERRCGNEGLLAHLTQDEFVLVSLQAVDAVSARHKAEELLRLLQEPVRLQDKEIFPYPAIGVAFYPEHETDVGMLLRRARVAAEQGKREDGFRLYSRELDAGAEARIEMEAALHRALEREEFVLHYQPQLSLQSGRIVAVEALLRWNRPGYSTVSPADFIPVLEECGLMAGVGAWVARTACRQARDWQVRYGFPLRIAINVSPAQLRRVDFVKTIAAALRAARLDAKCLELELTENLILENVEATINAMHELKALGVCLSLDDFGTGYSSLSYLHRYPIDRIKIDRSFVHDMMERPPSAALVRSILVMADNLGLLTIAEGVETAAQCSWLRTRGCAEMQGFLFSPPVPADQLSDMLAEGRGLW